MGMLTSLQGYRTYILGTLGIVVAILWLTGVITPVEFTGLENVLGFGGLLSLRAAVANASSPQG